ncbi:MAG: aspartyl protease family protein [Bacteroidales bacterium]|nr:aspartyl protease family protein [Bacteroidales bacterium]
MSITYPFRLTRIDGYGYHSFITFFHGDSAYNALIDCGASQSFLSADFFEEAPKKPVPISTIGMESGFAVWAATLNRVELSGINLADVMLLKTDLSNINQSLSSLGFSPVDGIFGCDLLQRLKAKIDFEKRQLTLHNAQQTHPLRLEGDSFFTISLILNDKPLRLLLDTGASQTLLDMPVANTLFPDISTDWEINNGPSIGISPDDIVNATRPMTIVFGNAGANDVPHWEITFNAMKMNKINRSYQSVNIPPIDAILGIDFLNPFCKSMNFSKTKYCVTLHLCKKAI